MRPTSPYWDRCQLLQKKKDLSKLVSSKESTGSEFGGLGLSGPTVKEHMKKTDQK